MNLGVSAIILAAVLSGSGLISDLVYKQLSDVHHSPTAALVGCSSRQIHEANIGCAPSQRPEPAAVLLAANESVTEPKPISRSLPPSAETFSTEAYFNSAESVLRSDYKRMLDDFIRRISGSNYEVIKVIGHTDSEGSSSYNLALSLRRAQTVKAYLVSRGVDRHLIYTEGLGNTLPVAGETTSKEKAKNRRVEITVVVASRAGA